MKNIVNFFFVTMVFVLNTGCLNTETKVKALTEKELLKINFNGVKSNSDLTLYMKINKNNRRIALYTKKLLNENNSTKSNNTKDVLKNDEVHKIISEGRVSSNDEVCMRIDSKIKEVTIVGLNDDAIINIRKKACIPLSQIKELDAYKLIFKDEDGIALSIHIENEDFSKQKSSI